MCLKDGDICSYSLGCQFTSSLQIVRWLFVVRLVAPGGCEVVGMSHCHQHTSSMKLALHFRMDLDGVNK